MPITENRLRQCLQTKSAFPKHSSGILRCILRDLRILGENVCILCSSGESELNCTYSESFGHLPHNCVRLCGLNVRVCIWVHNQMQVEWVAENRREVDFI